MAALQTLQELRDWQTYRTFSKERLKTVDPAGEPFFVSREDVDFDLKGKPWSGRAFLVGRKGEVAAKRMKKEGCRFLQGTCRVEGRRLLVEGVPAALLKRAEKTCRKLVLGYELVPAEGEGDPEEEEMPLDAAEADAGSGAREEAEPDGAHQAAKAGGAEAEEGAIQLDEEQRQEEEELPAKSAPDPGRDRRKAALEREARKLSGKIRAAAAAAPAKRSELQRLLRTLQTLLGEDRLAPAGEALARLRALLETIEAAAGRAREEAGESADGAAGTDADAEAESSPAARRYRARQPDLVARLTAQIGEGGDATRTRLLQAAAHRAEDARRYAGGKRFEKANAALDDVEKVVLRLESAKSRPGRAAG